MWKYDALFVFTLLFVLSYITLLSDALAQVALGLCDDLCEFKSLCVFTEQQEEKQRDLYTASSQATLRSLDSQIKVGRGLYKFGLSVRVRIRCMDQMVVRMIYRHPFYYYLSCHALF